VEIFDLVYLGVGENSHTASLMPESNLIKNYIDNSLSNKKILVAAVWVPEFDMYRITLMPSVINNSKEICFLVIGDNKAIAVRDILQGPFQPLRHPAQLIQCTHGKTVWYLDKSAAKKLILL